MVRTNRSSETPTPKADVSFPFYGAPLLLSRSVRLAPGTSQRELLDEGIRDRFSCPAGLGAPTPHLSWEGP